MSEITSKLQELRVSYKLASLDFSDCAENPVVQFDHWLSTVFNGQPRGRVLLLKGLHEEKFLFYTNYNSAKGQEIQNNDKVAMTFIWLPLQRQIRIEGVISKADERISDDYFKKRPRGSQLGAIASPQSKKIPSRAELELPLPILNFGREEKIVFMTGFVMRKKVQTG
jgi:pyridoxamine 5'-phosphate oxidase